MWASMAAGTCTISSVIHPLDVGVALCGTVSWAHPWLEIVSAIVSFLRLTEPLGVPVAKLIDKEGIWSRSIRTPESQGSYIF